MLLGTSGQFCTKYRGLVSQLGDNCEFCASKNGYVDGEVCGLYGFTSLVLPKASLIVGNRNFRNADKKPQHNYLDSKTRYGLLPSEVDPQLFQDPNGEVLGDTIINLFTFISASVGSISKLPVRMQRLCLIQKTNNQVDLINLLKVCI